MRRLVIPFGLAVLLYVTAVNSQRPRKCNQPSATGSCRGYFTKYYFNSASNDCQRFVYGGCRGNQNRFNSMAACQATCQSPFQGPQTPTQAPAQGDCALPKKRGRCRARHRRYYYDTTRGQCRMFYYGGCSANGNNFRSMVACADACASSRPIRVGPSSVVPTRGRRPQRGGRRRIRVRIPVREAARPIRLRFRPRESRAHSAV